MQEGRKAGEGLKVEWRRKRIAKDEVWRLGGRD